MQEAELGGRHDPGTSTRRRNLPRNPAAQDSGSSERRLCPASLHFRQKPRPLPCLRSMAAAGEERLLLATVLHACALGAPPPSSFAAPPRRRMEPGGGRREKLPLPTPLPPPQPPRTKEGPSSSSSRGEKAKQRAAQQELKQRQRAEIYALNRVMTELEQQQFDAFCKQMQAAGD